MKGVTSREKQRNVTQLLDMIILTLQEDIGKTLPSAPNTIFL